MCSEDLFRGNCLLNFWLGLIVVCPFYDNTESTARVMFSKLSAIHYNGANCTTEYYMHVYTCTCVIMADSLMTDATDSIVCQCTMYVYTCTCIYSYG